MRRAVCVGRAVLAAGALLLFSAGAVYAQSTTATIEGTARDNTQAVLPGVDITATNVATGLSRTATTDASGFYKMFDLPLGDYEVAAKLDGFRPLIRRGIRLEIGQAVLLNVTMELGSVEESVVVVGGAPLINLTNPTVSGVVDETQLRALPLNSRDLIGLVPLQATAQFAKEGTQVASRGYGVKVSIAGGRYNQNYFSLDGTDIRDSSGSAGGATGALTGVETVKEFEVITNAYSAEYGNYSGGVFNAITKSGTNNFRGSAFEFLRNSSMDAANFFDTEKPAFSRNQFGGTIGGPIVTNRTFFFFGYEGLRQRRGVTATYRVPTAGARQGILPGQAPIAVHPAMVPWLTEKVFPLPSPGGRDFGDGTADFVRVDRLPTDENFWTTRIDHSFKGNDTLFFRYLNSDGHNSNPSLNVDIGDNNDTRYATVGYNHIFSSTLLGSVTSSYTKGAMFTTLGMIPGAELPLTTWGDTVVAPGAVPSIGLGSGISNPGGDSTEPRAFDQQTFQQKANVTWQKGRHAFKFGGEYTYYKLAGSEPFSAAGNYSFRNLADALRGIPDAFAINTTEGGFPYHYRQWYTGAFVQDDIRLRSNLTINLGVRYEYMSVVGEKDDRLSNVRDNWLNPGLTAADIFQIDDEHPLYENPCPGCFAPRVGVVWDPFGDGRTSVRSGFGIYYVPVTVGRMSFGVQSQPPTNSRIEVTQGGLPFTLRFPDAFSTQRNLLATRAAPEGIEYRPNQPTVYRWGVQVEREIAPSMTAEVGYAGNHGENLIRVVSINNGPYPLEVVNGRIYVPVSTGTGRIHPELGRTRPRLFDTNTDYHALTAGLRRRGNTLDFRVQYTLSKNTTDSDTFGGGSDFIGETTREPAPVPPFIHQQLSRGLSQLHQLHNMSASLRWALPFGRDRAVQLSGVADAVLGNWDVSVIQRFGSGVPLTVGVGGGIFPPNTGNGVDLRPGGDPNSVNPQNPTNYINPDAFMLPTLDGRTFDPRVIGNLENGTTIGPGLISTDLALAKNVPLRAVSEEFEIQLRLEVFNLFNRPNFGRPNSNVFQNTGTTAQGTADPDRFIRVDPSFGRITRTSTTARQLQFGLRIQF